MKRTTLLTTALMLFVSAAIQAPAQWPVPPPAPAFPLRSGPELEQLLAPIALYPDPLIAQILPATTQPAEVVIAARYVFSGGDMNQIDLQPWSPSIKAVARYPEVLKMMDERLDWTTQLGQAFLYQQVDVMNAVQRLRVQAQILGNLRTTPQQCVVAENGIIEIFPANPSLIYVPVYRPEMVFARRGFFLSFGIGFSIGLWLDHDCDWYHHNVIVWSHDRYRPHDWWYRPSRERFAPAMINSRVAVWHSQARTPFSAVSRADRGWATREVHTAPAAIARPVVRAAEVHEARRVVVEPRHEAERVVQRSVPAPVVRSYGNAFVGGESARDVRAASSRGQQSREAVTRPPPSAASAPSARGTDSSDHHRH